VPGLGWRVADTRWVDWFSYEIWSNEFRFNPLTPVALARRGMGVSIVRAVAPVAEIVAGLCSGRRTLMDTMFEPSPMARSGHRHSWLHWLH